MVNRADAWFQIGRARPAEFKLFCFPYAGGSASIYRSWLDRMAAQVQVIPVELPGRGTRLNEPPFTGLPPLVEALTEVIAPFLDSKYAFFGYSMGAVIGFELARALRRKGSTGPQALFVAAHRAPQIENPDPFTYDLPKEEFIRELHRLEGTPKSVLEHAELMELMLPLLRADFQLIQTYEYYAEPPLACPIIAYGGLNDADVPRHFLQPWAEQTSSDFALQMFPGDHFFIKASESALLASLAGELNQLLTGSALNPPPG